MRNIKIVVEYDGTDFCGWQVQPNGRTVQGTLDTAVFKLFQQRPTIHGSGRTDAGVHARAQVANFKVESGLPAATICKGLNSYLPADVRVRSVENADASFHARFSAKSREYHYTIARRQQAIGRHYAWFCRYRLDVKKMRRASVYLLGAHAFEAFSKHNAKEKHYLSTVEKLAWSEDDDTLVMEIRANRFLHNMVRIIVGTLVDVGRGRLHPDAIREILDSKDRDGAGTTAPAHGLQLTKVYY